MWSDIKNEAKSKIKGNVWKIFGIFMLIGIITSLISTIPGLFGIKLSEESIINFAGLTITTSKPTLLGSLFSALEAFINNILLFVPFYYIINLVRNSKVTLKECFSKLYEELPRLSLVVFLQLAIISLGSILLIIPGIIASVGLTFVYLVLIDYPDLKGMDVIKKCWELMRGHKGDFFVFGLSFILWLPFCILFFPIIYVIPYITVSEVIYYEKVVKNKETKKEITETTQA